MKPITRKLFVSFFFFVSFWSTEGFSQAIVSKKFTFGKYEPNLGKIVKIEQYQLGSSDVLHYSFLLNYSIFKVRTMTGHSYFTQLECKSLIDNTIFKTLIIEKDLTELIDAIYEMERSAQVDIKTQASYLEARFDMFDNSSLGYYVSEGHLKWFFNFDRAADGFVVQVLNIKETKRTLERALAKISEFKEAK